MATIPASTKIRRHVRKTIAFDGTAGNGAVGSVAVFTLTGRVRVDEWIAFCTETLADAGGGTPATLDFGVTGNTDVFTFATPLSPADGLLINQLWAYDLAAAVGGIAAAPGPDFYIAANPILTVANEAITNGTLVIDMWYYPVTDDGALAGDDIDEAYVGPVDFDDLLDWAAGVETGWTPRQALRIIAAALAGEVSGAGTTTVVIRDIADTKTRITATVTGDGDRTALTLDAT